MQKNTRVSDHLNREQLPTAAAARSPAAERPAAWLAARPLSTVPGETVAALSKVPVSEIPTRKKAYQLINNRKLNELYYSTGWCKKTGLDTSQFGI